MQKHLLLDNSITCLSHSTLAFCLTCHLSPPWEGVLLLGLWSQDVQIQSNQPRDHTYIISFIKLTQNKPVFLLPSISPEPGLKHPETTHTAQSLLKSFKLSHPKFMIIPSLSGPSFLGKTPQKLWG